MVDHALFDYNGYFTIVLTEFNSIEILQQIFDALWSLYVTNVNIVTNMNGDDDKSALYTYFPYTENYCNKVIPQLWNNFSYKALSFENQTTNIFEKKFRNLYDCPIWVATFNEKPSVLLTKLENNSYFIDGIDGIILRQFSQIINFDPILMITSGDNPRGHIYPNGTITGALKLVIRHQIL